MLNSFWGRFGMRDDLVRAEIIRSDNVLRDRLLDPKIQVASIVPVNEDCMMLNYRSKQEARETKKTTNVVIAAFTTAYARMELYKYLDMLGDRVYYYDTDGIMFISRPGDPMPATGLFLGDLTDELEGYGPGAYIIEFVSGGPKNYTYLVFIPDGSGGGKIKSVVKVKGHTLNFETNKLINFEVMKAMVTGLKKNSSRNIQQKYKTNSVCGCIYINHEKNI